MHGCRILLGYPTTPSSYACSLSDSSWLSDNSKFIRLLVVGFLAVIRQLLVHTLAGCRILLGYPTTLSSYACWLSDSSRLSDNSKFIRLLVVGFFSVIRQLLVHTLADCRILLGYPTTLGSYACSLSDSSRLSDNSRFIRLLVVGFFSVIRQPQTLEPNLTQKTIKVKDSPDFVGAVLHFFHS